MDVVVKPGTSYLTVDEITRAELYLLEQAQVMDFNKEHALVKSEAHLPKHYSLMPLHPYLDGDSLLRVGGRLTNSPLSVCQTSYHLILYQPHHKAHRTSRASQTSPRWTPASLSRKVHIIGSRKMIRSTTRGCTICQNLHAKPQSQMMGQLPKE